MAGARASTLIERVAGGKALPAEILNRVVERTDGIPLFIEELTKTLLEGGLLREEDGRYVLAGPLPPLAIPSSLQDSLMARLDRLAPVKEVAQIGAAIGREFSYEVLAAVARRPDDQLRDALDQLVGAGLVFRRGTPPEETFIFKHAFVQDAAYGTLLRGRRQELHSRHRQGSRRAGRAALRDKSPVPESVRRCSLITGSGPRTGRRRSTTRSRQPNGQEHSMPGPKRSAITGKLWTCSSGCRAMSNGTGSMPTSSCR